MAQLTTSKKFETMQLANGFTIICDGGQKLDTKGETVTVFGESGVNAYLRSAGGEKDEGDGRLIVDRGVLLLQRTFLSQLSPNAFSIRLFDRSKMDDSVPEMVIPLEYINNQLEGVILRSNSGKVIKSRIAIPTTHSLNTVITMEPMVVTVKMSVVGATTLLKLVNGKLCGHMENKDNLLDSNMIAVKKLNL